MKNFSKLLMAVILLASYSCVQDTTEDLAPVVSGPGYESGSGEVRTLPVSMPASTRTELGEKGNDGKYPVYWCEGDVLSVNGEPTTNIEIDLSAGGTRSSLAVFTMPVTTSIPYSILYPYEAGLEVDSQSGMYPVRFAAEQKHTEGSFAEGAAPMYAWSDGFSEVKMQHLATALRFTVKAPEGKEVDLRYISVSTDKAEPIAGVFDVYCGSNDPKDSRAGEIVARESATSTVFYNFDDNSFKLTSKPQTFYIAVPKGEYSRFSLNFVAQDGGVCVRTFDATGDKVLLGGKVREFPEVTFEANSKMLLIGNDADMRTFASEVANGTFDAKYDGALLVSDVTLNAEQPFATIEGYTSVFEGRNYTIKGLTQPLFGENVVATISNLNVEGAINETSNSRVGLIARSLAVQGTIFNCSAKGSLTYANPNITASTDLKLVNVGGIVGGVYGGSLSLSKSDVAVTVNVAGRENASDEYQPCVGGVVGYACDADGALPTISGNKNLGQVVWNDGSNGAKVSPYIGGVAGCVSAGEFADNINEATLLVSQKMYDLDWGGVVGAIKTSVERCKNEGSLIIDKELLTGHIGGVVGRMEKSAGDTPTSLIGCENHGKLLLNDGFYIKNSCNIGGVIAYAEEGTKSVEKSDNYGEIIYNGKCYYASSDDAWGKGNATMRLGGVVGLCCSELLSACNNMQSANIEVAGEVSGITDKDYSVNMTGIAGVVGVRSAKQAKLGSARLARTEKCSNSGNVHCSYKYCGAAWIPSSACIGVLDSDEVVDCHNLASGNFVYESSIVLTSLEHTTRNTLYLAGLISFLYSDCNNISSCSNAGDIIYDNATALIVYASGIVGFSQQATLTLSNCGNSGDITMGDGLACESLYLGGIAAQTNSYKKMSFSNCYNSGNITVNASMGKYSSDQTNSSISMGGLFGQSMNTNPSNKSEASVGVNNSGNVICNGSANLVYIGGYCGNYSDSNHTIQFSNSGRVAFSPKSASDSVNDVRIGGYIGNCGVKGDTSSSSDADFDVKNSGVVDVQGSAKMVYASGGIGYLSAEKGVSGIEVSGKVTVDAYANNIYASGVVGYMSGSGVSLSEMVNASSVEVIQKDTTTEYPENIWMGGVVAYANLGVNYATDEGASSYANAIKNCSNTGDIIYKGMARDGAYAGGIAGQAYKAPIVECYNNGEVISSGHAGDWASRLNTLTDDLEANRRATQLLRHDLAVGGVVGETDSDIFLSSNEGSVTHTCLPNPMKMDFESKTASSRFDVGGVAGRVYRAYAGGTEANAAALNFTTVSNKGTVTIYGEPNATTNSSYVVEKGTKTETSKWMHTLRRTQAYAYYRVNVAGVVGRILDDSETNSRFYITGCTNTADVVVPEAGGARCLNVAGVAADVMASHLKFSACNNKGYIAVKNSGVGSVDTHEKKYYAYYINLGGIAATCFDVRWRSNNSSTPANTVLTETLSFENCTNEGNVHYGESAASFYHNAGGILAQAMHYVGDLGANSLVYYCGKDLQFKNCSNKGNIDFYSTAMKMTYNFSSGGGILGNAGGTSDHYAFSYTGGRPFANLSAVSCTVDHCTNEGSIQFDRCNGLMSSVESPYMSVAGGIVGYFMGSHGFKDSPTVWDSYGKPLFKAKINSCTNKGRVWSYTGYIGGIIGVGRFFVDIKDALNTGDIVVARNENGEVRTKNWYGARKIYAGGIAGALTEYERGGTTRMMGRYVSSTNGLPGYYLGTEFSQCVNVFNSENRGDVGATAAAGGIVGEFQSLKGAALQNDFAHNGGVSDCINTGNIYALEGNTTNAGAIVGVGRSISFKYQGVTYENEALILAIVDRPLPVGAMNCQVGGQILRGANKYTTADESNYFNLIYGEDWDDVNFTSVIADAPYDGCTLYGASAGENGATPTAKR